MLHVYFGKSKKVIGLERSMHIHNFFFNLLLHEFSGDMEIYSFTTTSCTFIIFDIYSVTIWIYIILDNLNIDVMNMYYIGQPVHFMCIYNIGQHAKCMYYIGQIGHIYQLHALYWTICIYMYRRPMHA